jgi:hypothetical protein
MTRPILKDDEFGRVPLFLAEKIESREKSKKSPNFEKFRWKFKTSRED